MLLFNVVSTHSLNAFNSFNLFTSFKLSNSRKGLGRGLGMICSFFELPVVILFLFLEIRCYQLEATIAQGLCCRSVSFASAKRAVRSQKRSWGMSPFLCHVSFRLIGMLLHRSVLGGDGAAARRRRQHQHEHEQGQPQ